MWRFRDTLAARKTNLQDETDLSSRLYASCSTQSDELIAFKKI
jgi:hypothetical protein